ncbi:hypothetical protein [Fodinibius sp.]|uniref:hypothetical protein n=1 Tax=Fodinibius sp. TaxID=1872440 RepID=UPI002ACDC1C2|nr:hypothetical protein [Fodinibius sp.]MDZ7658834.1 hypothetical protein [Fodinibius sp.]
MEVLTTICHGGFVDYDQEYPSYIIITGTPDLDGTDLGMQIDDNTYDLYHREGTPVDGTNVGDMTNGYMIMNIGFTNRKAGYTGYQRL